MIETAAVCILIVLALVEAVIIKGLLDSNQILKRRVLDAHNAVSLAERIINQQELENRRKNGTIFVECPPKEDPGRMYVDSPDDWGRCF